MDSPPVGEAGDYGARQAIDPPGSPLSRGAGPSLRRVFLADAPPPVAAQGYAPDPELTSAARVETPPLLPLQEGVPVPGTEPPPPGRAVVEMSGELDVAAAPAIATALTEALARRPQVTVDLVPRRPWGSPPAPLPFWVMTWTV